ncbi:histidine phosphatase superfamily [Thelonectria olida]|uniref:Histidine phosphatase superfamily n=1 Tax=Thelonectria olida TaxID=1576542 RepID=A0A9P8WEJ2_9HYPO|nr:histidine phosphatase superfamily [Thelonectria olida]
MPTLSLSTPRSGQIVLALILSAALFLGLRQYLTISPPSPNSVLGLLAPTSTVSGQSVDLDWYPPSDTQINNLTSVLNGEGIYEFIFNTSQTPDKKYGTYNWCNMPHARKKEYVKPSGEYDLRYVEVIQRHHKRTPYAANAFPVESYQWNCDNQGLYYFGKPSIYGTKSPAEGFWQGFKSDINPFVPVGWVGTCQFPQITAAGLDDSWTHGNDLYDVYHNLLHFLPSRNDDWRSQVVFRVTNNQITSQVAGMFINGMWDTTESVPLIIQQAGADSLEPQYSCNVSSALFVDIQSASNANWHQHLNQSEDLFAKLDDISGVPPSDDGFHVSFDHYFDNLSARQCHDKPLPCKLVNGKNSTTCIDQDLANAVYRMGQWEYSHIYRDAASSLAASSASYGVWIAELASHLRAVVEGRGDALYFHNFAHDGSISRLLSILQIDVMVWPGMGSEVVFELYSKDERKSSDNPDAPSTNNSTLTDKLKSRSGYYVRVLFSGKTLRSSNPSLDLMEMIPVETLLAYFDGLAGENASLVKEKCTGSGSSS